MEKMTDLEAMKALLALGGDLQRMGTSISHPEYWQAIQYAADVLQERIDGRNVDYKSQTVAELLQSLVYAQSMINRSVSILNRLHGAEPAEKEKKNEM